MKIDDVAVTMIGLTFKADRFVVISYNPSKKEFVCQDTETGEQRSMSFHSTFQFLFCTGDTRCIYPGLFKI
jgi:hypothetical protein